MRIVLVTNWPKPEENQILNGVEGMDNREEAIPCPYETVDNAVDAVMSARSNEVIEGPEEVEAFDLDRPSDHLRLTEQIRKLVAAEIISRESQEDR